jgi:chromosome transmission fidelity protein 18
VFTNLPQVSYVDPSLERCTLAHEWLSGADIFRSNKTSAASNNTMEHHSMQRHHMPSAAGAIHLLCRVETRTNLTFSTRQLADARYQLESNTSLAQKFVEGLSPKARVSADTGRVATETIPYSLWMLSAGVGSGSLRRTVSSLEVLSKNERAAFDAHVSLLRSLGLTYVAREDAAQRAYSEKGLNTAMRLEPQIDRLVRFQDLNLSPGQFRKSIPSAVSMQPESRLAFA